MTHVQEMIRTHPGEPAVDAGLLSRCIDACFDCAQSCTACADACLAEQNVKMLARCIRLNLDCADVCAATGNLLTREVEFDSEVARAVVEACSVACRVCGEECGRHAEHMEHCRVCEDACRDCEQACNDVVASLAP
jgi:hypothetical protein